MSNLGCRGLGLGPLRLPSTLVSASCSCRRTHLIPEAQKKVVLSLERNSRRRDISLLLRETPLDYSSSERKGEIFTVFGTA